MSPVLHLAVKEWALLRRDRHALLLLFVMPALFILIMSLALRDRFAAHSRVSLAYYLVDRDGSAASAAVADALRGDGAFRALPADGAEESLRDSVLKDRAQFLVEIPKGFGDSLAAAEPLPVRFASSPSVDPAAAKLFGLSVQRGAGHALLKKRLAPLGGGLDFSLEDKLVSPLPLGPQAPLPSSVQQSVPAWLIFSMFFIAIPLSTTWVQERRQGTYDRLRSMGVGGPTLLLGKLLPYVGINLLQAVLMLLVGVYIVPLFGGESLSLGRSPGALAAVVVAASFASVSYALLIANLVSTNEQATILTGVSNLLMAALGGIMVPRFVMPVAMQKVSLLSPMAWGLDGFLDVFLRQGALREAAGGILKLFVFGLAACGLAAFRMDRRRGGG